MTQVVKYVATIEESTGRIMSVEFPQSSLPPEGTADGLTIVHVTPERMTENFMGIGWNPMLHFWDGSSFVFIGNPPNRHAIYNGTDWEWDAEAFMQDIRALRNSKLGASDWTQVPDAPLTDDEKSAWQSYRQELRDFPSTLDNPASLAEIVWPMQP